LAAIFGFGKSLGSNIAARTPDDGDHHSNSINVTPLSADAALELCFS